MTSERIATAGAPAAVGPYSQAIDAGSTRLLRRPGRARSRRPASWSRAASTPRPSARCATSAPCSTPPACGFADVVKTTCFLADMGDFAAFNEVYAPALPRPAAGPLDVRRSAALPRGALVEVEAIAVRPARSAAAVFDTLGGAHRTVSRPDARRSLHHPAAADVAMTAGPSPRRSRSSSPPASARGCARARPRCSTRSAAGRCSPTCSTPRARRPASGRSSSYSPATDAVREVFADEADFALQDEPRGTARRASAPRSTCSRTDVDEIVVLSGDVPLIERRARGRAARSRGATNGAPMALVTVRRDRPGRSRPGRARRATTAWPHRRGEGRHRRRARHRRDQRRPLRVRRRPGCAGAHRRRRRRRPRPASCTCPQLVELARADGRPVAALEVDRTTARSLGINDRAQLADAERRACARASTSATCAPASRIEDPATRVHRRRRRARRGRHASSPTSSCAARRASGATRSSAAGSQLDRLGRRGALRDLGQRARVARSSRTTCASGPSPTFAPGAHIGRGAELGNFAEVKNEPHRRRAPSSTTSATSATPRSARA